MKISNFVFKMHKWLAVGAGLMTVLWFFSGIFMTIPDPLVRALQQDMRPPTETAAPYRSVRVSVADAIAATDRALGAEAQVHDVSFRKIGDTLFYRMATRQGVFLVSGADGTLLDVTESVAMRIAILRGARAEDLGAITRVEKHGVEYTFGPLPAWRIESNDAQRRIYYVEVHGGDVRVTTRRSRLNAHLVGLHSLEFLNGWLSRGAIRAIMWVFAIVGTAMSLFGSWILWIQWQNWRAGRSRA